MPGFLDIIPFLSLDVNICLSTHNLDRQKSDEKLRCKAEASFDITITPGSPEEANSALMFKSAAYI